MNENGNDEEAREAIINPVQRRESSASRFLKHFRPDRSNPAYHSEGKGLRKRRNWASERQLNASVSVDNSVIANNNNNNEASGGAGDRNAQHPQRSHSFSEPDAPLARSKESSVRDSFRWRFNSSKKAEKKNRGASPPSGQEVNRAEAETPKSPEKENEEQTTPEGVYREPIYTSVVNKQQQLQQHQQQQQPLVTGGHRHHPQHHLEEADYVNYEMFAGQSAKQHEPDLLRNLPYQQQQQQQQQMGSLFANRRNRLSASINRYERQK